MIFIQRLFYFDRILTDLFYNLIPHSPLFQKFFEIFAPTGITTFLWIITFAALVVFEEKKHKKFLPYFATSLIIAFLLSNLALKPFFARQRPTDNAICPKDYSFPSGHATLSFAAASTLAFFDRKRRFYYYSFATLIAYSRIYLGCHFFLDVLAGALLGIAIGQSLLKLDRTRQSWTNN